MKTLYLIILMYVGFFFILLSSRYLLNKTTVTAKGFAIYLSGTMASLVVLYLFISEEAITRSTVILGLIIFTRHFVVGYPVVYFLHGKWGNWLKKQ